MKQICIFLAASVFTSTMFAQVGIGIATPNTNSMLDISSNNKGLLLPRLALTGRTVASPLGAFVAGMTVYNTATAGTAPDNVTPGFYLSDGSSWLRLTTDGWSPTGNTGTTSANFIGTVDDAVLKFRVFNQVAGVIDHSLANSYFGYLSGGTGTDNFNNTGIGFRTLSTVSTGFYNTAVGTDALKNTTTGYNNTAVGANTLLSVSGTNYNTAVGSGALATHVTGNFNTAVGGQSLQNSSSGEGNTAVGSNAHQYNSGGNYNSALGFQSLRNNGTGGNNTSLGAFTMVSNADGNHNVAVGAEALFVNVAGSSNVAVGASSMRNADEGNFNTAVGMQSLHAATGSNNTATGYKALFNNTSGFQNTAMGVNALLVNTGGNYNTAVGYNTGNGGGSFSNGTCIGIDATVTATDQVRIGNVFVGSIGGYQNWTNISDGRFKENVQENVPGIAFIKQLRPVTYTLNREKINEFVGIKASYTSQSTPIITTGFIAQEVELAAKNASFNFSGVDKPKNDKDPYGLRYAEFVVPLVKAVQEQQVLIEKLMKEVEELRRR